MHALATALFKSPFLLLLLAVCANGALWAVVIATFPKETPAAILHYTAGVGIDFIGEGRQIYAIPIMGSILLVGNTLLGWLVKKANIVAFWLLWSSMPVIQIILIAAYLLIWRLNT